MDYTLCILSHADHTPAEAEVSFVQNVNVVPRTILRWHDANRDGFCRSTRNLWRMAAEESPDEYVFWLEHDFRFTRPVDLHLMANILDHGPYAQVSLMRQAVNKQERKAGGIVQSRPGEFTDKAGWLEHTSYFTTNPSLMRRDFMQAHTFGDDRHRLPQDIRCEGLFGMALIEQGFRFAVMGNGEPWVEHVGWRDATGHGY